MYNKIATLKNALEKYAIDNNHVDAQYYVAISLITEIREKAFKNAEYLQVANAWLFGGSTIELKKALEYTSYDDSDIINFNAMSLMDTAHLIMSQKCKKCKKK